MFHRSERLFLRPAWPEDIGAIYRELSDKAIVRNLATAPWPYGEDDARAFVALERPANCPNFLITLPGTGVIGSAGLGVDEETGMIQTGYWIGREHWGQGFATEATRAILKIAHNIGHRTITASHFLDNPASGRVLAKAGFRRTGVVRPGFSLARGGYDPVACFEIDLDDKTDMRPCDVREAA